MRIVGIGIDVVETARIQDSIDKFGDRFLHRVFLPGEIEYANKMKKPALHLAARFAAKEAVSKAFGTGIGASLGWKDMEIVRDNSGPPRLVLHYKGEAMARRLGVREVLISLSHTDQYGAANAVVIAD